MNLIRPTGGKIIKAAPDMPTSLPSGNRPGSVLSLDSVVNALADTLVLPDKKSSPKESIDAFTFYIYGYQKIGKTSFTSMFPDACHIFYEPSGEDYELFSFEPQSWDHFKAFIVKCEREKLAGTLRYKNFTIDVVDQCFEQCLKAVCARGGTDHPPNDYGKTWDKIGDEFRIWIHRLARIGGLIVISHAKEAEIERADGQTYSSVIPTCKNKCHLVLAKFCTMTGYYHVNSRSERMLGIIPNNIYEAGNRFRNHFMYKDTGEKISFVPMGSSEQEAYRNFRMAFDNLLPKPEETANEIQPTTGKKNPFTLRRSVL